MRGLVKLSNDANPALVVNLQRLPNLEMRHGVDENDIANRVEGAVIEFT